MNRFTAKLHGGVSRRTALAGGAAAIAAAAITRPLAAKAQALKLRKNILNLSATELDVYKHAIQITKDRSKANPNDKTGYDYWASLHDNFDQLVHSGCAHFSERFFPWHRQFLYDFEQLLQLTDPPNTANLMIPYWDWSVPLAGGALYPAAFTDKTSPLYDATRFNISPPPWDAADLKNLISEKDWSVFGGLADPSEEFGNSPGTVESGPHNTLHTKISRSMKNPATAVKDPIFWSFHGGIDLVWNRWQKLHLGGGPQPYQDPNASLWYRDHSVTVGSVTTSAAWKYDYDYDYSIDKPALVAALSAPFAKIESAAAAPRAIQASTLRRLAAHSTQFAVASPPGAVANSLVHLTGIKVFTDRSYHLDLFLHPKTVAIAPGATARSPYHVRSITLWQSHHENAVQTFVRLTQTQMGDLQKGWVFTLQAHDDGAAGAPAAAGMHAMMAGAPARPGNLPDIGSLVGGLSLEER